MLRLFGERQCTCGTKMVQSVPQQSKTKWRKKWGVSLAEIPVFPLDSIIYDG